MGHRQCFLFICWKFIGCRVPATILPRWREELKVKRSKQDVKIENPKWNIHTYIYTVYIKKNVREKNCLKKETIKKKKTKQEGQFLKHRKKKIQARIFHFFLISLLSKILCLFWPWFIFKTFLCLKKKKRKKKIFIWCHSQYISSKPQIPNSPRCRVDECWKNKKYYQKIKSKKSEKGKKK